MAYVLTKNATGQCSHGGSAKPMVSSPRVKIDGAEVLTLPAPFEIKSCNNKLPNGSPFPCVVGLIAKGAERVKVMGVPVALDSASPKNIPTGASTTLSNPQTRVKGT